MTNLNIEPAGSGGGALVALLPVAGALFGIVVNNALTSSGLRDRANQQALREAAADHLAAVAEFLDHALHLREDLQSGAGLDRRVERHRDFVGAWTRLRSRAAAVRVYGPTSVAEAALALRRATGNYGDELERW
jgi:hypothetical protein